MRINQGHAWLFAFADLAFLLLITISLISDGPGKIMTEIYEMKLPIVPHNADASLLTQVNTEWRIYVERPIESQNTPFKLAQENGTIKYVPKDLLIQELRIIKSNTTRHPLLISEPTSYSEDLLFAAGAISQVWSAEDPKAVIMIQDNRQNSYPSVQ